MSISDDMVTGGAQAARAVEDYAGRHPAEAVALPELVDAIAEQAMTSVHVAKRAIFTLMDKGQAEFTPDFKIKFAARA